MTNSAINVPIDVKKYLVKDEIVDGQYHFRSQTVFATRKRLFLQKGKSVSDISYEHISGCTLYSTPKWAGIGCGTYLVANFIVYLFIWLGMPGQSTGMGRIMSRNAGFGWLVLILMFSFAVSPIVASFIWSNRKIRINVSGISKPVVLMGDKGNIDALFRLLNIRRFQTDNSSLEKGDSTLNSKE